jgi:general secretion pathway protein F
VDRSLEVFLTQLSVALKAGTPPGLLPTQVTTVPARLRASLPKVFAGEVPLSAALVGAGLVTSAEAAVLSAGERSGTLPVVLEALARTLRERRAAARRLLMGLAYPAFLVVAAGALLPLPLVVTDGLGAWLSIAIWPPLIVGGALVLALIVWPRLPKEHALRGLAGRLLFSLPIVGGAATRGAAGTFFRLLSQLVAAGVPITLGLEASLAACGHPVWQARAARVRSAIDEGATLDDALRRHLELRPEVLSQIASAERVGALDTTLERLGKDESEAWGRFVIAAAVVAGVLCFLVVAGAIGGAIVTGAQGYFDQIDRITDDASR